MFDVTSRDLFINWTEPHDNNAPVTGYNITYQNPDCLVMAPNNQPQDVTVTSMEEQAMITDLHPGENYSFIVIAINDICPSVPSIPVSVRTMEEGIVTICVIVCELFTFVVHITSYEINELRIYIPTLYHMKLLNYVVTFSSSCYCSNGGYSSPNYYNY